MKDFIVLIATVILGLAIAMIVIGFKSKAETLGNAANGAIDNLVSQF